MRLQLLILRGIFLILSCGAGLWAGRVLEAQEVLPEGLGPFLGMVGGVGLGAVVILLDVAYKKKSIATMSAVAIGLVTALVVTWLFSSVILPLITFVPVQWYGAIQILLICFLAYFAISFIMQTRDDFRFIIPYIEFSKDRRGPKPVVLDTSVIIDGRIADVAETKIIEGVFIVPRSVLQELQHIADSAERARRNRGRRGLDVLARLQKNPFIEVQMLDAVTDESLDVDARLVKLAKSLEGKLMTNDYNLNKIAQLQGVEVININELANAMKAVVLPGEELHLKVLRPGEEAGQGVGYLEDGTMVVVEQGRPYIGQEIEVLITSIIQTSAGKLVFGRLPGTEPSTGGK